ncbi:MAG TPA: hypothetical protein VHE37_00805, partial [Nevskiaceae bacterium]|nr:hypothetical protein [Nevskiaceae bacterium]
TSVATAYDETVYVTDFDNNAIRAISYYDGSVSTLVHMTGFSRPFGIVYSYVDDNLYVETDDDDTGAHSGTTGTIWKINRYTGVATVVARDIGRPRGLEVLSDGRLALSDLTHQNISILDPVTGNLTLLAGSTTDAAGYTDATGSNALFNRPYGLALASNGDLLVADQNNNVIREVTLAGVVTTYAGTGTVGSANGPRATATFSGPEDVAVFNDVVYVSDQGNHLVRVIFNDRVSVQAGDGNAGFFDGNSTDAEFFGMEGIDTSPGGHLLWIADGNVGNGGPYNRVRFIWVS